MVTFTHASVGTSPQLWTDALAAADLPVLDLTGVRRLVVVAAHPDDESLGAGGLIATAAAQGLVVEVVIATDGEASHPDSPTHSPDRLAELRQAEVATAVTSLAPDATLALLHLPDSGLTGHLAELTAALRLVLAVGAATLVVSPWIGDGHPDHWAAGTAALDAAAGLPGVTVRQYPLWAWHWGTPDAQDVPFDRLWTFPLGGPDIATAKRRALAAHRSQTSPLSDAVGDETLLPATLTTFYDGGHEYFLAPAAADLRPPPPGIPGVQAATTPSPSRT